MTSPTAQRVHHQGAMMITKSSQQRVYQQLLSTMASSDPVLCGRISRPRLPRLVKQFDPVQRRPKHMIRVIDWSDPSPSMTDPSFIVFEHFHSYCTYSDTYDLRICIVWRHNWSVSRKALPQLLPLTSFLSCANHIRAETTRMNITDDQSS